MAKPAILLLDEPSLGLAPKIVDEIFAIIAAVAAAGTGVLLVEQNAAMALDVAQHGMVLELGEVTLAGPRDSLRRSEAVTSHYL
jgi:branched-chain amino acid transport system ATP-binding protein